MIQLLTPVCFEEYKVVRNRLHGRPVPDDHRASGLWAIPVNFLGRAFMSRKRRKQSGFVELDKAMPTRLLRLREVQARVGFGRTGITLDYHFARIARKHWKISAHCA